MNLLLNNVRGEITEANSFYADPYDAVGRFDYVMANPPFNVDEVVYERVKDDARFNTYGIPKNKSKTAKKASDKKETVPNANYLWISYFASALKETGKAALVMANSASDAGNSEYDIRKKMIEEGIISQMVTLPSNMFSSVTLPATLWFFDKAKAHTDKRMKSSLLMPVMCSRRLTAPIVNSAKSRLRTWASFPICTRVIHRLSQI